jgi:Family of unknown function (DUF6011)
MQATTPEHRFATIDDARAFAMAGNAIITLQSLKTGAHFTFKITKPNAEKSAAKGYSNGDDTYFVKVLTNGSADEGDWIYLGMIRNGTFALTRASSRFADAPSYKAFFYFWHLSQLPADLVVHHEMKCGRCGRTLTHPESLSRGIGPECAGKMEGGGL